MAITKRTPSLLDLLLGDEPPPVLPDDMGGTAPFDVNAYLSKKYGQPEADSDPVQLPPPMEEGWLTRERPNMFKAEHDLDVRTALGGLAALTGVGAIAPLAGALTSAGGLSAAGHVAKGFGEGLIKQQVADQVVRKALNDLGLHNVVEWSDEVGKNAGGLVNLIGSHPEKIREGIEKGDLFNRTRAAADDEKASVPAITGLAEGFINPIGAVSGGIAAKLPGIGEMLRAPGKVMPSTDAAGNTLMYGGGPDTGDVIDKAVKGFRFERGKKTATNTKAADGSAAYRPSGAVQSYITRLGKVIGIDGIDTQQVGNAEMKRALLDRALKPEDQAHLMGWLREHGWSMDEFDPPAARTRRVVVGMEPAPPAPEPNANESLVDRFRRYVSENDGDAQRALIGLIEKNKQEQLGLTSADIDALGAELGVVNDSKLMTGLRRQFGVTKPRSARATKPEAPALEEPAPPVEAAAPPEPVNQPQPRARQVATENAPEGGKSALQNLSREEYLQVQSPTQLRRLGAIDTGPQTGHGLVADRAEAIPQGPTLPRTVEYVDPRTQYNPDQVMSDLDNLNSEFRQIRNSIIDDGVTRTTEPVKPAAPREQLPKDTLHALLAEPIDDSVALLDGKPNMQAIRAEIKRSGGSGAFQINNRWFIQHGGQTESRVAAIEQLPKSELDANPEIQKTLTDLQSAISARQNAAANVDQTGQQIVPPQSAPVEPAVPGSIPNTTLPPTEPPAQAGPTLPRELQNVNGTLGFNYGAKRFTTNFDDPIDMALYIVRDGKKLSRRDEDYMTYLRGVFDGLDDNQIRNLGSQVSNKIKGLAATSEPGELHIESTGIGRSAGKPPAPPQKPPAPPAPEPAPEPEPAPRQTARPQAAQQPVLPPDTDAPPIIFDQSTQMHLIDAPNPPDSGHITIGEDPTKLRTAPVDQQRALGSAPVPPEGGPLQIAEDPTKFRSAPDKEQIALGRAPNPPEGGPIQVGEDPTKFRSAPDQSQLALGSAPVPPEGGPLTRRSIPTDQDYFNPRPVEDVLAEASTGSGRNVAGRIPGVNNALEKVQPGITYHNDPLDKLGQEYLFQKKQLDGAMGQIRERLASGDQATADSLLYSAAQGNQTHWLPDGAKPEEIPALLKKYQLQKDNKTLTLETNAEQISKNLLLEKLDQMQKQGVDVSTPQALREAQIAVAYEQRLSKWMSDGLRKAGIDPDAADAVANAAARYRYLNDSSDMSGLAGVWNNWAKSFRAKWDASASGIQTILFGVRHPDLWRQATAAGAKSMFSPEYMAKVIAEDPTGWRNAIRDGVVFLRDAAPDADRMINIHIPGVSELGEGSDRMFTTTSNMMRYLIYKNVIEKNPNLSGQQLRTAVEAINNLTGVGHFGKTSGLERHTLFAGPFIRATVQALMNTAKPGPAGDLTRSILGAYVGFTTASIFAANAANGEETDIDPDSSNFMSVRNMVGRDWQPYGPLQPYVKFFAKVAKEGPVAAVQQGKRDGLKPEVLATLLGGTAKGVVQGGSDFFGNRLSPSLALGGDIGSVIATGKTRHGTVADDYRSGKPEDLMWSIAKIAYENTVPFAPGQVAEEASKALVDKNGKVRLDVKDLGAAGTGAFSAITGARSQALSPTDVLDEYTRKANLKNAKNGQTARHFNELSVDNQNTVRAAAREAGDWKEPELTHTGLDLVRREVQDEKNKMLKADEQLKKTWTGKTFGKDAIRQWNDQRTTYLAVQAKLNEAIQKDPAQQEYQSQKAANADEMDKALTGYYKLFKDAQDGGLSKDQMFETLDQYLANQSDQAKSYINDRTGASATPLMRERSKEVESLQPYFALDKRVKQDPSYKSVFAKLAQNGGNTDDLNATEKIAYRSAMKAIQMLQDQWLVKHPKEAAIGQKWYGWSDSKVSGQGPNARPSGSTSIGQAIADLARGQ